MESIWSFFYIIYIFLFEYDKVIYKKTFRELVMEKYLVIFLYNLYIFVWTQQGHLQRDFQQTYKETFSKLVMEKYLVIIL